MKTKYILGLCSAAALALATTSQAITTDAIRVSFDNGANWDTVTDGQAGRDINAAINQITASFDNGGGNPLNITISIGGTGNGSGTGSPKLDISIGGSVAAGLSVIVEFSANGFTPPSTGTYLTTQTVNGSGYTVTETTRIGTGATGNNLFAAGGSMPSIGPLSPVSVGQSSGLAPVGTSDPYSITISDVITAGREEAQLSVDTHVRVPDGGSTMIMLGSALSVLGGLGVFRKKARKA